MLLKRLQEHPVDRVVLEATGGVGSGCRGGTSRGRACRLRGQPAPARAAASPVRPSRSYLRVRRRRLRAASRRSRRMATLASTPLVRSKWRRVTLAMTSARVVFPQPGGP